MLLINSIAAAQSFTKLVDEQAVDGEAFGIDLAFHGEELWVGAPYRLVDADSSYSGAVLLFAPNAQGDWIQTGIITPADSNTVTSFGRIFEVNENEAIIAGINGDVSVFRHLDGQWHTHQTLMKYDPNDTYDRWTEMTISGNYAFIAARGKEKGLNTSERYGGSIFVFEKIEDTWKQSVRLGTSSTLEGLDKGFGRGMCVSGDILAVEGRGDAEQDRVVHTYMLVNGEWTKSGMLFGSESVGSVGFGRSIACTDQELIIHAYSSGVTYAFNRRNDTWIEQAEKIIIPGDERVNRFLEPIQIIEEQLFIISNTEHVGDYSYVGSVYQFKKENEEWVFVRKIQSPDIHSSDGFGSGGIALSDSFFVVGAPYRDSDFTDDEAGAVYIFDREFISIPTGIRYTRIKPDTNLDVFPNPFAIEASVAIMLDASSTVSMSIYNMLGQEVTTLFRGVSPEGRHRFNWTPGNEGAGVYFLKLEIGNQIHFQQLVYSP